jgi:hypothetical protein
MGDAPVDKKVGNIKREKELRHLFSSLMISIFGPSGNHPTAGITREIGPNISGCPIVCDWG